MTRKSSRDQTRCLGVVPANVPTLRSLKKRKIGIKSTFLLLCQILLSAHRPVKIGRKQVSGYQGISVSLWNLRRSVTAEQYQKDT